MKIETGFIPPEVTHTGTTGPVPWVTAGFVFAAIVAIYWRTVSGMVAIWSQSETFNHGFVVLPIALWLVWRERAALRELVARPWPPALLGVAGAGFVWLLSDLASVAAPAQFALVFMLQFALVAVLGLKVASAIFFPLAFLLFAVPAGEFLVPKLMDWTAEFTILALRATGIPVYREGNHFMIPSGSWSVVEACSGIRYLVASMMGGALFAYLTYRTFWKRAAFFAASMLVPLVANWLRAYLIVMIGHLSDNRLAVGVDHLIYGWFFFGIVIVILFWVGSLWREDGDPSARTTHPWPGTHGRLARSALRAIVLGAAGAIVAAGLWLPAGHLIAASANPPPGPIAVTPENGWRAVEARGSRWKPHFHGQRAEYQGVFAKDGREVGVYVAYYNNQAQDRELVNSENVLVRSSDLDWKQVASGSGVLDWSGDRIQVRRAELATRNERLAVAQWYWIGGRYTASDLVAKVLLALAKLGGGDDDSATVILYTPQGESSASSEEALRRFAAEMSGSVTRALEDAGRR